jgi:hypothetical protein
VLDQVFSQVGVESLSIERLSDGSTAIVDNRVKSVHSLNPSATLVWEACAKGATTAQICKAIEAKSGSPADAEVIYHALAQLQRANLIESESPISAENIDLGRRSMLKRAGAAGAIAIPVVLTLTAAEQRAYAFQSGSGTTTPAPTTPPPTTTPSPPA